DLASVTKVAATLQAVMFLQEQGLISLDEKLITYLPELEETNKADLTIRNILMHEAGLRPWLPFYQISLEKDLLSPYVYQSERDSVANRKTFGLYYPTPRQKEAVWQEIIDSELRKLPKDDSVYTYRYSDLGFMFLQMLVEAVSHQPLDEFVDQHVYQPLGLKKTMFNPLTKYQKEVIAPTEYDYYFRNAQVWGSVHDQNAQVLGGVAGHAGLFSNAHELSKLMLMNLNGGFYGGYKFLHSATMQHFTKQQKTGNRRGLGWDKPDMEKSNTSSQASALTFGHTGFTGTAVWVDPEYDLIYVFLSNRVYPSAENKKLMENNIRSKIQDVIYQAMASDF
ncbi:MAG: serine hydrolase, partial [Bacteroidota bacterium]